jgi:hypothetical protein
MESKWHAVIQTLLSCTAVCCAVLPLSMWLHARRAMRALSNVYFQEAERLARVSRHSCYMHVTYNSLCFVQVCRIHVVRRSHSRVNGHERASSSRTQRIQSRTSACSALHGMLSSSKQVWPAAW